MSESEINLDNIPETELNQEIENKIKVQKDLVDKYAEENIMFINEFIRLYEKDAPAAKAFYYSKKLKFDVNTNTGLALQKKMLHKYLEGLQWVLYYYYKGAQHWRWYYPYHYAPMISDIDNDIVLNYLSGKVTIDEF